MNVIDINKTVVEVRESYMKMVSKGLIPEWRAIAIVKEFEQAKKKMTKDQKQVIITI